MDAVVPTLWIKPMSLKKDNQLAHQKLKNKGQPIPKKPMIPLHFQKEGYQIISCCGLTQKSS